MLRYLLGRLIRNLVSLFLFLSVLFFVAGALPGDYTHSFLITPDQREAMQEELGLDQPLVVRYLLWLKSFFSGNLGWSLVGHRPVKEMLADYLPGTLFLFLTATLVSFALGTWLGKVIAWRRGALLDTVVSMAGMWLYASFAPLVAFLLVTLTKGKLGWLLPTILGRGRGIQGAMFQVADLNQAADSLGAIQRLPIYFFGLRSVMMNLLLTGLCCLIALAVLLWATRHIRKRQRAVRLSGVFVILAVAVIGWTVSENGPLARELLFHSLLPMLTLVLVFVGEPMLLMRTTMMETMRDDYVVTAQAKGMKGSQVRDRHAARTALLPVVSRVLLSLPIALTGSLIVETIFSWPGIGSLLLSAADLQDYDTVIGVIAAIGILVVLAHTGLDILNAVLDPRVRSVAAWQEGG